MLFLSYAEEDGEAARHLKALLREFGIDVYDWQSRRGGRFIDEIQRAIGQADAYIALMSPSFLASQWCIREQDLALQREQDLRAANPDSLFIYVLKIAETPYADGGFLRSYDWLDITSRGNRDEMLSALVGRLTHRNIDGSTNGAVAAQGVSLFRNRREELDRVLNGLANIAGPHFWVVVAPPQLGKTWFLDRVSTELGRESQAGRAWTTRLIDLRGRPPELRRDAAELLCQLFDPLIGDRQATLRDIARAISRNGTSYLCLLDSAELLTVETVNALREQLGKIYHYVQLAGNSDVRLAFVVATRREKEWRGVAPSPRLTVLSLTEFGIDVVVQALRDLAAEMNRAFSFVDLEKNAQRVYDLGEGMPALLAECMRWIQAEEWLDLERLETRDLFELIAHPYIVNHLLCPDSLYPANSERAAAEPGTADPGGRHRRGQPDDLLDALEQAFRLLAPYRLFTQSHLRHHVQTDPGFASALAGLNWSVEDLWRIISLSALLRRPLDEPWQEIHSAIRRLLYRYFYQSSEQQALAHREARKYVEVWAGSQAGKEQVIGLLESLWHEACEFRLSQPAEMQAHLCDSARALSGTLRSSEAYTAAELRDFAAERMREDEEFRQVLDNTAGLFDRLISIIRVPPTEQ